MLVTSQLISIKKITSIFWYSIFLWLAFFSVASAEVITSFDADYEIRQDGLVTVTETILYDFEGASRHGIYRKIKNSHPQPASVWYKDRYVDIKLLSVTKNGQSEPYSLESYEGLSVRIGDANRTITGAHTYKIVYQLDGALAEYPGEGTELYWNVTGNEWEVPIQDIKVVVHTASDAQLLPTLACYAGQSGSKAYCSSKGIMGNEAVFYQDVLSPGQGLTIGQQLTIPGPVKILEETNTFWFWIWGSLAWFIGLGVWIYRWRFKYRPSQTIIPQYEPLPDFKPMFSGVLIDNRLDSRDISAGIVYLAQQGFISIKQTTDKVLFLFDTTDYEVTLLRPVSEVETNFQKKLLSLLFDKMGVGKVVRLSEIKNNTNRLRQNAKTVKKLKKAVKEDLLESGYFELNKNSFVSYFLGGIFFLFIATLFIGPFVASFFGIQIKESFMVAIFFLVFIISWFKYMAYERRSQKGYEALDYLKGFKDFLSVTEKERYKFHNAPALSPQQFMEYLPYAIAFGVEKEWAEVFKDIQIGNPDWYSSTSGTNFNAVSFTSGIGAFSTAFATSSGSSGGSGGGGSSGGGGGGGGGGSW